MLVVGDKDVDAGTVGVNKRGVKDVERDVRVDELVERFTPIAPGKLNWEVTINDAEVWTRPWTFAMTLTRDDSQRIFEYACHEGNYGLRDILSGARAEDPKK